MTVYRMGSFFITPGVKDLTETHGAYWLCDVVFSHQPQLRGESFQLWLLKVAEDHSCVVTCQSDSDQPELIRQEIEFTDYPAGELKLYCCDGVLMLPSEY